MKVCPSRVLSVLESISVLRTCPADGAISACCTALRKTAIADKVLYPQSPAYHASLSTFWRRDIQQIYPACIVQPQTADEVSLVVTSLVEENDYTPQCQFSVRSGGHGTVVGSTSRDYGVTVDLALLNSTVYNPEAETASIGPGARWKGVYTTLAEYGVVVPGGRGGTVGVGGFVTGGGNSFHSAQHGFTCDAVVNFEIVLASGEILHANETSHAALFKSLKGGSSNFGIVTRIDIETFPSTKVWGGVVAYDHASTVDAQVDALVDFTANVHRDPHASLIPLYTYNSQLGVPIIANSFVYTEPVQYPGAFQKFYGMPNISDSMRLTGVEGLVGELEPEAGLHNSFFTLTFANDPIILKEAISIHGRMIEEAKKRARSESWSIISLFQPLPGLFAELGQKKRGGNVLGLDEKRNYILDLLWLTWDDFEDTELFDWIGETFVDELQEFARSVGGDYPYVYLNYAAENQNPLRSYGEHHLEFMRRVAEEYDPLSVFQDQAPGGFKVTKA
ncbi:hypothetical protein BJY01DRAFT_222353 [Aspergillus pseudoustus]|uniref:FAD-binding PCMH-type domain-containing protein n=1 Tax=Aspergillus pseudoustus TaxID=1810923 RepID=A0ABR4J8S8_9EURO